MREQLRAKREKKANGIMFSVSPSTSKVGTLLTPLPSASSSISPFQPSVWAEAFLSLPFKLRWKYNKWGDVVVARYDPLGLNTTQAKSGVTHNNSSLELPHAFTYFCSLSSF